MRILAFGEILFDVFGEERKIGGAPLNFAAHAVRAGAEAHLVSAVGNDELGDIAIASALHHGVGTAYLSRSEQYETGVCRVTLDDEGVPRYDLVYPAAYDDVKPPEGIEGEHFDAIYFGTLALRGEANRRALSELLRTECYGEVFVDVNVRQPFCSRESLLIALESATVIKISDEELDFVMNEAFSLAGCDITTAIGEISRRYPRIKAVIITRGAEGSVAYDTKSGETFSCPAVKTEVVSTVGAGDSFSATFLVGYMNGESIPRCLERASVVSAHVVSRTEAIPE